MSKTYFSRHQYHKAIEIECDIEDNFAEIYNCGKPNSWDYTDKENRREWASYNAITRGLKSNVHDYNYSRHPNGPKGHGLAQGIEHREYHRRFGDCYDRSDRCRAWKKVGRKERRNFYKNEMNRIIKESLDED